MSHIYNVSYMYVPYGTWQIDFTEMDMVALQRATRLRLHSLSYPSIDPLLYRLFDAPLVHRLRDKHLWVHILKRTLYSAFI
jgi:hypothetical protein